MLIFLIFHDDVFLLQIKIPQQFFIKMLIFFWTNRYKDYIISSGTLYNENRY